MMQVSKCNCPHDTGKLEVMKMNVKVESGEKSLSVELRVLYKN